MAYPMPISARDFRDFRPNSVAVIAAREALEKAQAAAADADTALETARQMAEARPEDEGFAAAHADARAKAEAAHADIEQAQKALDAAEEARAKADPTFKLRVPNGRTKALVAHAINTDHDAPNFPSNSELVDAVQEEAADAGLSDEQVAALKAADAAMAAGDAIAGDVWPTVVEAALATQTGKVMMADRQLYLELLGRHRIRHHLVLDGKKSPLAERDLEGAGVKPHLGAINLEISRMWDLSEEDAKNSAAP